MKPRITHEFFQVISLITGLLILGSVCIIIPAGLLYRSYNPQTYTLLINIYNHPWYYILIFLVYWGIGIVTVTVDQWVVMKHGLESLQRDFNDYKRRISSGNSNPLTQDDIDRLKQQFTTSIHTSMPPTTPPYLFIWGTLMWPCLLPMYLYELPKFLVSHLHSRMINDIIRKLN